MVALTQQAVLAILATVVAGHGFVQSVTVNGVSHEGYNPSTHPYMPSPPPVVGWSTTATDLGFVEPNAAGTAEVICHKSSKPGQKSVPVNAGDTLTLTWNTWPESHKGPVIDYLAQCSGSCSSVDKSSLRFFKIAQKGLTNGVWAADELIKNGNKWQVTIPRNIAAGNYVLRHEIIGLHGGMNANGAQLYPQCINLQISGSGSARPSGVAGTSLYKANDAGILFNIHSNAQSYPIPGPAFSPISKREHARDFEME